MLTTLRKKLRADGAVPAHWESYEGWKLNKDGQTLRFILPMEHAEGNPWFWRPEFFGAFAGFDKALLDEGWVSAFLDLPNHYGCPKAVEIFAGLHTYATEQLGLASKVAITALSRAGLSAYNFASAYPEKVCAIYADNAVCDFRNWPGGFGVGPGSAGDWKNLLEVYGLTEVEAQAYDKQPLSAEVLQVIVAAKIPVLHVAGDSDEAVSYEENTVVLRQRLESLGGDYREITVPGGKHHPHGFEDPTPIVDFLTKAFSQFQ
ncbi:MAG: pimeloyl-ACP methyl ester carboxylesterase [Lentimonas sp.]|jgi:pimeloyl-ACP methyl ester carboxylesterase